MIKIEGDVTHERKVLDTDNYFMVKIEVINSDGKLAAHAEIGWIDEFFNEQKFKQKNNTLLLETIGNSGQIKILSIIEFENKEDYDKYKNRRL